YRTFGVAQGFGFYDDAPGLLFQVRPHVVHFAQQFAPGFCLKPFRSGRQINAAALAWLDRAPAGRPVFLFVNYMEPHEPWLAEPLLEVTHASVAEEDINPWLVAHYGPSYDRAMRVLYDGSYKLITTSRGDRLLFDLASDPDETHDLAARDPARTEALARRLDS